MVKRMQYLGQVYKYEILSRFKVCSKVECNGGMS